MYLETESHTDAKEMTMTITAKYDEAPTETKSDTETTETTKARETIESAIAAINEAGGMHLTGYACEHKGELTRLYDDQDEGYYLTAELATGTVGIEWYTDSRANLWAVAEACDELTQEDWDVAGDTGYRVMGGDVEIHYPDAETEREAAEEYVGYLDEMIKNDDGSLSTAYDDVDVWPANLTRERAREEGQESTERVTLDPDEPECECDRELHIARLLKIAKIAHTEASDTWNGCEWSTGNDYPGDLDGMTAAEAKELAKSSPDARGSQPPHKSWADAAEVLEEAECDAEAAQIASDKCLEELNLDDFDEALKHAREATSLEAEYGDASTWGPLAQACEALCEIDDDPDHDWSDWLQSCSDHGRIKQRRTCGVCGLTERWDGGATAHNGTPYKCTTYTYDDDDEA